MRRHDRRENSFGDGDLPPIGAAGETVEVDDDRHVTELILPPPSDSIEELTASGRARRPSADRSALHDIERVSLDVTTRSVLDDLRKPC